MPNNKTKRRPRSLTRPVKRKNNFKNTLRRPRAASAEPYKNIVAEKIGEGGYGVVTRPPARCGTFFSAATAPTTSTTSASASASSPLNTTNNVRNFNSIVFYETYYKNPNYVSKLTERENAEKELELAEIIKKYINLWRDYYCLTEFICGAPKPTTNKYGDVLDTFAIAPYCGVPLQDIIDGKVYMTSTELCNLVDSLKRLIIGVGELHSVRIYHQDIHTENILFNSVDGRLRLIDFGLAIDLDYIAAERSNSWRNDPAITTAKLLDSEQIIYNVISPLLNGIITILDRPEISAKSTPVIDECYKKILSNLSDIPRPQRTRNRQQALQVYVDYIGHFLENFNI